MATRCDLNGILDQIKTTFDAANTTTASPIDLSQDLTQRVNRVMTVHPELIPIQASFYPCVTSFILQKDHIADDIAGTQLSSKRQCEIIVNVVGAVANFNVTSNDQDPADRDINNLMENVELALRSIPNIGSKVQWNKYSGTKYYTSKINSQTHIRAGIITLSGKVFY